MKNAHSFKNCKYLKSITIAQLTNIFTNALDFGTVIKVSRTNRFPYNIP